MNLFQTWPLSLNVTNCTDTHTCTQTHTHTHTHTAQSCNSCTLGNIYKDRPSAKRASQTHPCTPHDAHTCRCTLTHLLLGSTVKITHIPLGSPVSLPHHPLGSTVKLTHLLLGSTVKITHLPLGSTGLRKPSFL